MACTPAATVKFDVAYRPYVVPQEGFADPTACRRPGFRWTHKWTGVCRLCRQGTVSVYAGHPDRSGDAAGILDEGHLAAVGGIGIAGGEGAAVGTDPGVPGTAGYVSPPSDAAAEPELGSDTLLRCLHAVRLYKARPGLMVVSGGKVDANTPGPTLAKAMHDFSWAKG